MDSGNYFKGAEEETMKQMDISMRRIDRPDLVEYHTDYRNVLLEIFFDNYHDDDGWVVRIVSVDRYGRKRERDISMKGRKDSSPATLRRNAIKAILDDFTFLTRKGP